VDFGNIHQDSLVRFRLHMDQLAFSLLSTMGGSSGIVDCLIRQWQLRRRREEDVQLGDLSLCFGGMSRWRVWCGYFEKRKPLWYRSEVCMSDRMDVVKKNVEMVGLFIYCSGVVDDV
jgi:hypothetical protein